MKIVENSTDEEHYEGQILLQQKQAVKDKGVGNEIDNMINEIQKKCDKRMKKLIRKQQGEIQEFSRIWEEKKLKLETNHKFESAIIGCIYGEGSARMDKLKLLDAKFAKEMEENNLLKDVQFKDLEVEQLAARNAERQKAAQWLAEAKACCSSELRAVYRPESLGSQSEEDAGCSQSSTHIFGAGDVVPITRPHVEDKNPSESACVQGNDVAPSDTSVLAQAEEVGGNAPFGTPSYLISINPQSEVGVTFSERSILAMVEQLNQPKHLRCLKLFLMKLRILLTLWNYEILDFVNPVELSNASNEGYDKGDTIGLPDALVNQRDGTDETPTGALPLARQIFEPSEQMEASPHCCDLLPPQVPEDQIHRSLSAELQDQGAQVVKKQNTFQFEVAASKLVDSVTILQSNTELQDRDAPGIESQSTLQIESSIKLQDRDAPVVEDQGTLQIKVGNSALVGTVTPVQCNADAQAIENCEQLYLVSIDVSPSCNQSTAIEVGSQSHDLGRNSSQTAEDAETEVLSHESVSHMEENLEIQTNHLDIGSVSRVAYETSVELSASSQNTVAMSQAVVGTVELPNQAVLELGIDVGHLRGSSYLFSHPNHQVTSWDSPSLYVEPLQNELDNICKETEQLEKSHEGMMSRLKSDCEKEIQEIIAQIRNKYEVKLQDAEAYWLKLSVLNAWISGLLGPQECSIYYCDFLGRKFLKFLLHIEPNYSPNFIVSGRHSSPQN
ncbi:hypothetical protein Pfo_007252 [Paulownia fortunei]|nr:hypothetical protein Pfo_007252 [Paulownia fortunei]